MKMILCKIPSSRWLLIPDAVLNAVVIEQEVEIKLEPSRIVIRPLVLSRVGWFEGCATKDDIDTRDGHVASTADNAEWQCESTIG